MVRASQPSKHLYPVPLIKNSVADEFRQERDVPKPTNPKTPTPDDDHQGRIFCSDRLVGHYSDPTRVTCSRWLYCDGAGRHEWFWCPDGTYFHEKACDFYDKRVCFAGSQQGTDSKENGDTQEKIISREENDGDGGVSDAKETGDELSEEKPSKSERKSKK